MKALLKKEIQQLLNTPIAYLAWAVALLLTVFWNWFFEGEHHLLSGKIASLSVFFEVAPWVMVMVFPAMSMRSIAEEQQNGTLFWLFSKPVSLWQLIGAKYMALNVFLLVFVVLSWVFIIPVYQLAQPKGNLDWGVLVASYLGLMALGKTFNALGLMASSFFSSQITAYLGALLLNIMFYFGFRGMASYQIWGSLDYYVSRIGLFDYYHDMVKGLIDFRAIMYFTIIIMVSLVLTQRFLIWKKQ